MWCSYKSMRCIRKGSLPLQDADKAVNGQPACVQRLPLASMRQNSLQLTDWTKGLTMPGKKRGLERQRLQEKLVSVATVPAGLPAGGALPWDSLVPEPCAIHAVASSPRRPSPRRKPYIKGNARLLVHRCGCLMTRVNSEDST